MDNSCTKHGLRLIGLKTVSNQTRTSYAREDSIQYSEPAAVNADSHDNSVRTPRSLTTGFARESTAYDELYDAVEFRFDDISLFPDRLLSVPRGTSGTSPRLLINPTHSSWHEPLTPVKVGAGRSQQSSPCRDSRKSNKQKQNGSLTSVRVAQIR